MAEERIRRVRQYCVAAAVLCLTFLGVFVVQERTGLQKANAGTPSGNEKVSAGEGQLLRMGDELFFGGGHAEIEAESSAWSQIFGTELPEIVQRQGDTCVLVKKNGAVLEEIAEDMLFRRLTVNFQGTLTGADIYRVSGNRLYTGAPEVPAVDIPEEQKNVPLVREPKAAEEDLLLSLTVNTKDGGTVVTFEFNSVYEVTVTEDEEFLYLSLVRPHEKYDKIIVIDPGHGGIDPGTSGGGFTEASINLAVVRYLKEYLDAQKEWKVYYTRLNNTLPDLSTRVEFANALHADLLISVHCNYNPVTVVNGVEVLYSKVQGAGDPFNSKYLAELCSAYVTEATGLKERPLAERSKDLHIIKYCNMPMALIEFGYMSNKKDLSIITTEKAQRECAAGIYRAIEEAYRALGNPPADRTNLQ